MAISKFIRAMLGAGLVPEKRIFRIMAILAIVTTVISVAIVTLEVSMFPKPESKKRASDLHVKPILLKPPVPPVTLLPESITQHATKGRQDLFGTRYPSAEAVYERLDANIMLATPVNIYAKVTFFPTQEDADEDINETLEKRYPQNHEDLLLGSTIAKTGYDRQQNGYFIGWATQQYSIRIHASFARTPPVEKEGILKRHALPVAQAIQAGAKIDK